MNRKYVVTLLLLLMLPLAAPPRAEAVKPGPLVDFSAHVRPEEQPFADLALKAPSSAGFYYDSTGGVVVLVRDAAHDAAALAHMHNLATSHHLRGLDIEKRTGNVRVARAQYTFSQLAAWRDIAFDHVLGQMDGVVSLDLDEVSNRVTLGITADQFASMQGKVREKLHSLGVDPAAVAFKQVKQPPTYDTVFNPPNTINDQTSDPIAGGLAMHIQNNDGGLYGCTIGFAAQRDGVAGLVTASHCTSNLFNPDTDPVFQLYPRQIATASVDPDAYTCGIYRCRGADAAFFSSTNVAPMGVGLIARTTAPNGGGPGGGIGSFTIDQNHPYWYITGEEQENLYVGQRVDKLGATTGWTYGSITDTCVDRYYWPNTKMRCAYEANYVSDSGDSGGPVFVITDWDYSNVTLAGIHSAHDDHAIFAKLARIKSDLGGIWVVRYPNPPLRLSASISGPTSVAAGQTYTWSAAPYGGTPPYTYQWGGPVSGGTSYSTTGALYSDDVIGLTVWDATGASVYTTLYVTVCPDNQVTC
ncbi:MAG TPA: hypothetical protein VFE33_15590 [Thermoanaerobaculia bacterium]|nr:hypothetical protein [Thermoanaerobaculia bacterium]